MQYRSSLRMSDQNTQSNKVLGSAFRYNQNRVSNARKDFKSPQMPRSLKSLLFEEPNVSPHSSQPPNRLILLLYRSLGTKFQCLLDRVVPC